MPLYLSPVCNDQMFDVNGNPLNGGQIETYVAGSSTPAATYTSSVGSVQQANPILLNSLGKAQSPIWLTAGVSYKFIVKDSAGATLWTIDNVSGINDASVAVSEWVSSGFVPTYISGTSFSVPGDQRSILQVGRRIRTQNTSGLIYSGIQNSTFGTGVTTVTLLNDSGTLDSGLSSVWYGLISADNTSFPFATFAAANTVAVSNDDATNATHYPLFADGTAGQENVKTGTAKLTYNPSTGRLVATQMKAAILPDSIDLTNIKASTAQAQAGSDDLTVMTPAKTKNAIDAQVAPLIAGQSVGAVGTYAFCRILSGTASPGDVFTGANLSYTDGEPESIFTAIGVGTWQCMGRVFVADRGTLFKRIS